MPLRREWSRRILSLFLCFYSLHVFADSTDSDILDRRDVQNILFGNGSRFSFFNSNDFVFRGECIGTIKSFSVAAYYVKKFESFMKTSWGIDYGEKVDNERALSLKGAFYLTWDRYLVQPFTGVDLGFLMLPENSQNLFSYALLGADFQITESFGISTRERWTFPNNAFPIHQPLHFKMENALFEFVLYWQI